MDWLNYHHLFYFWVVAQEGSVTAGAERLRLAQPTVSAQLRQLEAHVGEPLFERRGRHLTLTATGRTVLAYADEIFSLGRELQGVIRGRGDGRSRKICVGVVDALPKAVVARILAPAFADDFGARLVVRESTFEDLLGDLAAHEVDLVLADMPPGPGAPAKLHDHVLGETGAIFLASARWTHLASGFPASLDGQPFLAPGSGTAMRRSLERWFDRHRVAPRLVAEFDDSAMLKTFAESGHGVISAPEAVGEEVCERYHLSPIGRAPEIRERFHLISVERRVAHPVARAILDGARQFLGYGTPPETSEK